MNNNPHIARVWRNSQFVTISKIPERTKGIGGGTLQHNFLNAYTYPSTVEEERDNNKTKGLNSRIG